MTAFTYERDLDHSAITEMDQTTLTRIAVTRWETPLQQLLFSLTGIMSFSGQANKR